MKHSTEELILAAHVVQRVQQIRNAKMNRMTKEEAAALLDQPADDLVAEAVDELNRFCKIIKTLQGQTPSA